MKLIITRFKSSRRRLRFIIAALLLLAGYGLAISAVINTPAGADTMTAANQTNVGGGIQLPGALASAAPFVPAIWQDATSLTDALGQRSFSEPWEILLTQGASALADPGQPTGATSPTAAESGGPGALPPVPAGERFGAALAYDAARAQIVLFGSETGQTWTWSSSGGWTKKQPVTSPPPRTFASFVFDAGHQRAVLFGGGPVGGSGVTAETWTWDGTNWTLQTPSNSPPPRSDAAMAYDEAHGVIVLFGGVTYSGLLNDTWTWDGDTWSEQHPLIAANVGIGDVSHFAENFERIHELTPARYRARHRRESGFAVHQPEGNPQIG